MFERYTEKARRVIFFARYEASQFGSPYIETEHLLLGLLREDKALTNRFLRSHASVESIRKQIEGHTTIREKVSTSVDLPLSNECKRVLAYAAEEAERLSHKHIGTEHLLLGLLREEKCFATEILHERGLRLEGRSRSVVEIRNRFLPGLVKRFSREHDKTQNAQNTPEESRREARLPESAIQGEEVDDPQDEDYQIQAVPYYERRSNVGKPHNVHRSHPREHAHYPEDENENDATQHTGQTTPLHKAFLLRHLL